MNPWDNPKIIKLRKELAYVCNIMIKIAKIPGDRKGYERYDYTSPEYVDLAMKRDKIGEELRIEWNKMHFERMRDRPLTTL